MKKTLISYALHICLCIAFLLLPYVFSAEGGMLRLPDLIHDGHDRTYLAVYAALLLFFYLNYYLLIPKLYFPEKYLNYFGVLLLFLIFLLLMSYVFDRPDMSIIAGDLPQPPDFSHEPPHFGKFGPPDFKPNQNAHTILIFLIGILASLFLSITRRLQSTEKDKMQAELSLLKAQINPHFLFNTLNSIYALAIRKDEKTADSVVQLAELMRYIMNNANDNVIGLEKEINYINNYISLQKSRLGNTVKIEYSVDGNPFGKQITPLILISFIENAFKHGVNPDENSEIDISIVIVETLLTLTVSNKKVQSVHSESGIGVKNTIERLDLIYGGKYELDVLEDKEKYNITLTLNL